MATYEKVSWFQRLKNDMKDMTFGEKLGHLWEYYKWFAIVGVLLIVTTISVVCSVIENSKELVYGGVVVNLTVSEEGNAYLKEGWFEAQGGDSKTQRIQLDEMYISNMYSPTYSESSGSYLAKLTAMISTGEVDYVLTDAACVYYLAVIGSFSPLEKVFTEEQLASISLQMIDFEDDDETYPIAIRISDLPFVKKHIASTDEVYIAFPGNTGRTEQNMAFLEYLMNWSE